MFTRTSVAVALTASAAIAKMPIKPMPIGTDANSDGVVTKVAASCTGGFGDQDQEGTFFIGYAQVEGEDNAILMVRGQDLCDNDVVEWDSDYTIMVNPTGGFVDTGYKLSCNKKGMKDMQENFEDTVDDKDLMKSIKDSKK